MPKPTLEEKQSQLESDIIETMLAGLKEWRYDLSYPESHSDMQGCVRALLRMYEVKRRPIAEPLKLKCPECDGRKLFKDRNTTFSYYCERCSGRGYILDLPEKSL